LVTGVILSYQAGLRIFPFFNNSPDNQSVVIKKNRWGSWQYTVHQPSSQLKTHFSDGDDKAKVQLVRHNSKIEFRTPLESANLEQQDQNLIYTNRQQTQTIKYQTLPNGIKEEIILTQPLETNQVASELVLTNLQGKLVAQTPVFYDNDNNYQFHFEKPFVTDASGNRTYNVSYQFLNQADEKTDKKAKSNLQPHTSSNNSLQKLSLLDPQELSFDQEQYTLVLTIDEKWLNDPARAYPIIIDPTVIHDESSEFGGIFDRVKDTGSGANPQLEAYYQELAADPATIGLWHFNETVNNSCSGGSDTCDSSGNGHHGNEANTTITDGLMGKARAFNGGSSYINVGASVGAENITFEAWVYRTSSNNYQGIVRKNNSYALAIHNDTLKFAGNPWTWIDFGIPVEMNTWTHLAVVQNGTEAILYKNGILEATVAQNGNLAINSNPAEIGRDDYNNWYWGGLIDEVRISSTSRTPEEIKAAAQRRPSATYTSPVVDLGTTQVVSLDDLSWEASGQATGDGETPFSTQDLVAQWNLNETSGVAASVAGGSCGSSCNGTLVNFTNTSGQDVTPLSGWSAQHKRWGAGGLMFDGIDDYVSIVDHPHFTLGSDDFTISFWIKNHNSPNGTSPLSMGTFTSYYESNLFYFSDNGTLYYYSSSDFYSWDMISGGRISFGQIPNDQWTHITLTREGNTLLGYKNGLLVVSAGVSGASYNPSQIKIGQRTYNTGAHFRGALDAISFYARTMPASEVLSNYSSSQIQFQTRTSDNGTTWEAWQPAGTTNQLSSLDSELASWIWDRGYDQIPKSSDTSIKTEGTGSLKLESGFAQPDANTVGLWRLEESGTAAGTVFYDSSGNNLHASGVAPTPSSGYAGKARDFNGSSHYLQVANHAALRPSQISIEAWVRVDSLTTSGVHPAIVSKMRDQGGPYGSSYKLGMDDTNHFVFQMFDGANWHTSTSVSTISAGNWYHIVGSYNGSYVQIFVNGKLERSVTWSGGINYLGSRPVTIGASETGAGFSKAEFFNGVIDEVKIKNIGAHFILVSESFRAGKDFFLGRTISSKNLSGDSKVAISVAADEPGTHLKALIGESAYANYSPDGNTVGLFHLDDELNSISYCHNSSPASGYGSASGVGSVVGKMGQAASFNGSSSYISVPNNGNLSPGSGNFTVEAWVNTDVVNSADHRIYEDYGSNPSNLVLLRINTSNKFEAFFRDGTNLAVAVQSVTIPVPGKWYHVVGVKNNKTVSIYVNGVLENSATNSSLGTITTSDGPLPVIGMYNIGASYWDGLIDEVRLSNVARTSTEIRQAFESVQRAEPVTVEFGASLDAGNLIANSGDTSFTIDATKKGLKQKGANLNIDDTVIIREKIGNAYYAAQGKVTSVTPSTGAVTVQSWLGGSTFPSGGFTANATVFKWQTEYFDLSDMNSNDRDGITHLSLRLTHGNFGKNIWIDNWYSITGFLDNPLGSDMTSSIDRYLQYRALFTSNDGHTSAQLNSVTAEYEIEQAPPVPDLISPGHNSTFLTNTPTLVTKIPYELYPRTYKYKIELCTNAAMTSDCQTFDQTVSSTGWNDTEYTVSEPASYTIQSLLDWGTTYYWRSYAIAPDGLNIWSDTQSVPYSFTTNYPPSPPIDLTTESLINPDDITDLTPEFSSVYQDRDPLDTALAYEIEVNTEPDFSGTTIWSSGKQSLSPLEIYERSPEISYSGLDLQPLTTYFWRMRFWDSFDVQGEWSTMDAFFTTYDNFAPPACRVNPTPTATEFEVLWDDVVDETSYVLERNVNGSGFSTWTTKSANITSATDTNISAGNSYQYRVKSLKGSQSSQWCTTSTLQPGIGNLRVD